MLSRAVLHVKRRLLSTTPSATAARVNAPALSSRFAGTPRGPEDAILGITLAYNADESPHKVNLGVGAYRDDAGLPFVLTPVRIAEKRLAQEEHHMEYLPVIGNRTFCDKAIGLAYGQDSGVDMGCVARMQTLSGTGALRMAGELMTRFLSVRNGQAPLVLLPKPSWANHAAIFRDAGCRVGGYRYYDEGSKGLDFEGCVRDLEEAEEGSVVLLHACAHNPTGVDFGEGEWGRVSEVVREKGMVALFDMAYQGFTSGDLDVDAEGVRRFVREGHRVILAQSFSKNFGLYGQRVGCLSVVGDSAEEREAVESQLKIIARPMYSNPPIVGVRLVEEILKDEKLEMMWREEMKGMAERIQGMRRMLREGLEGAGSGLDWGHVEKQNGMFCYSGLTAGQVDRLRREFSVYLTANGRISMAGVTTGNVGYLADAMHEVTK